MPTKWYWVNHGRLTRERKAYTSHRHWSITRPLPAARALKHQAPCLIHEHSTGSERVDALGLRAKRWSYAWSLAISAWYRWTSQASLSLSLPLTKVTHAQYRKRFRASYNEHKSRYCNHGNNVNPKYFERTKFSYAGHLRSFVRMKFPYRRWPAYGAVS